MDIHKNVHGTKDNKFSSAEQSQPQIIDLQTQEVDDDGETSRIGKYKLNKNDLIGSGFSSKVYKATTVSNKHQRYAIKIIQLQNFQDYEIELLNDEIQIVKTLNHPNILKCYDVYRTTTHYYIVTQYCPHGDLEEFIKLQKTIPEDKAILIMSQILEGYKYLSKNKILHRDIKPANIMNVQGVWKLGDFGFAKYCNQQYLLQKLYVGTPLYTPIECLEQNKYSHRSDIFALGVTFYEILTGQTPWNANDQIQLVKNMRSTQFQIPHWLMTIQAKQFLLKSLCVDYRKRLTIQQLNQFALKIINQDILQKNKQKKGLKRVLSKSVKNNFLTPTLQKNASEMLQVPLNKSLRPSASTKNLPRSSLKHIGLNILDELTGNKKGVRYRTQFTDQNNQIINNQMELVKNMMKLAKECQYLKLQQRNRNYLSIFMYLLGIKLLKMVGNPRQNAYKLKTWEAYKKSQKYSILAIQINNKIKKYASYYNDFSNDLQFAQIQSFKNNHPQLISPAGLNFRDFEKLFKELCKFTKDNILNNFNQIQEEQRLNIGNCLLKLVYVLESLKMRSTKQQQMIGFGLKSKPKFMTIKGKIIVQLGLKQLTKLCESYTE